MLMLKLCTVVKSFVKYFMSFPNVKHNSLIRMRLPTCSLYYFLLVNKLSLRLGILEMFFFNDTFPSCILQLTNTRTYAKGNYMRTLMLQSLLAVKC